MSLEMSSYDFKAVRVLSIPMLPWLCICSRVDFVVLMETVSS
jgi:hypothetical protein